MNQYLQLATFDVASEAYSLRPKLEFALRHIDRREPVSTSGLWQQRLTGVGDRIRQLSSCFKLHAFSEAANAAELSLRECRVRLVEVFGLDESSESEVNELQANNELRNGMVADWDAAEHSEYEAYLKATATEIMQPSVAHLERVRDNIPVELRPFFELGHRMWSIPGDLDDWCIQQSASREQRHAHLLNVIRPELQSLLQQCVLRQSGLNEIGVGSLALDSLEDDLSRLRLSVCRTLKALSSEFVEPGIGAEVARPLPGSGGDSATSTTVAAVGDAFVQGQPEDVQADPEAGAGPPPNVPMDQNQEIPFTENDAGVVIYGIQVNITSDAKTLLMHMCKSVRARPYTELRDFLNTERGAADNDPRRNHREITELNMRRKMTTVRKALRIAFNNWQTDPIRVLSGEPIGYFSLDRQWLATNVQSTRT